MNSYLGKVFYTKRKHGSIPISIELDGFLCGDKKHQTQKELFKALYGKKTTMTLERYFPTLKKPQPSLDLASHIFDICTNPKGIDLQNRSDEVRKLFYSGFGARCVASGYNPEDVLQEIYRGIIARNAGICPFDPKKSSFGHYVHMVCGCIVANYHRKMSKIRQREQVGIFDWGSDDSYGLQDVAVYAVEVDEKTPEEEYLKNEAENSLFEYIRNFDPKLLSILQGLIEKESRKSMASRLNLSSNAVSERVRTVRKLTLEWSQLY